MGKRFSFSFHSFRLRFDLPYSALLCDINANHLKKLNFFKKLMEGKSFPIVVKMYQVACYVERAKFDDPFALLKPYWLHSDFMHPFYVATQCNILQKNTFECLMIFEEKLDSAVAPQLR